MELYIFRHSEWETVYNCNIHTEERWQTDGHVNYPLGYWYIVSGVIYMMPYIPCLIVMLKQDLFRNSCYKIMFFLGLIDFVTLAINAVLTGFLTIQGAVACSYPNLIYIAGCTGMC
uniref:G_PROTEIN_RECEP_F1_2 domain-containing protein n=1 Tax=Steinernema glaseri TaxID=37863 RepID=A0A1I7YTC3_9BILA